MDFQIVKIYKDKEVHKNVKNIFLSMCDVRVFLTFTSLNLVLLWQLFYLFCSSIVINTVIVTVGTLQTKSVKKPENCENRNDPDLVQAFLKRNGGLNQILKRQTYRFHYGSKVPTVTITVFITILEQNR
jgi:hypothetical protein